VPSKQPHPVPAPAQLALALAKRPSAVVLSAVACASAPIAVLAKAVLVLNPTEVPKSAVALFCPIAIDRNPLAFAPGKPPSSPPPDAHIGRATQVDGQAAQRDDGGGARPHDDAALFSPGPPAAVLMTASTPSATMLIGLVMVSGPKLPGVRTLIAPLPLVWSCAN
jgi:hypothetical protein